MSNDSNGELIKELEQWCSDLEATLRSYQTPYSPSVIEAVQLRRLRAAIERLQLANGEKWNCAARCAPNGPGDPPECDWPLCSCDPHANKVIAALEEMSFLTPDPDAQLQGDNP